MDQENRFRKRRMKDRRRAIEHTGMDTRKEERRISDERRKSPKKKDDLPGT